MRQSGFAAAQVRHRSSGLMGEPFHLAMGVLYRPFCIHNVTKKPAIDIWHKYLYIYGSVYPILRDAPLHMYVLLICSFHICKFIYTNPYLGDGFVICMNHSKSNHYRKDRISCGCYMHSSSTVMECSLKQWIITGTMLQQGSKVNPKRASDEP
jgi:hypothetical protein